MPVSTPIDYDRLLAVLAVSMVLCAVLLPMTLVSVICAWVARHLPDELGRPYAMAAMLVVFLAFYFLWITF